MNGFTIKIVVVVLHTFFLFSKVFGNLEDFAAISAI